MMKMYSFVFIFLFFLANVYPVSPAHGAWMSHSSYVGWRDRGSPIYEIGRGQPSEWSINGILYISFVHNIRISNARLSPPDGITWRIFSFEQSGNRIIYHLEARHLESSRGTITLFFVDEDTMYFESFDGDEHFLGEVRVATLDFGPEHLLRRVRVSR